MDSEVVMEAVRQLRAATGLSQIEFAATVGKSYPTVQRYERIAPPPRDVLLKFVALARENKRPDLAKVFRDAIAEELGDQVTISLLKEDWDTQRAEYKAAHPPLDASDQTLLDRAAETLRAGGQAASYLRDALDPAKPRSDLNELQGQGAEQSFTPATLMLFGDRIAEQVIAAISPMAGLSDEDRAVVVEFTRLLKEGDASARGAVIPLVRSWARNHPREAANVNTETAEYSSKHQRKRKA